MLLSSTPQPAMASTSAVTPAASCSLSTGGRSAKRKRKRRISKKNKKMDGQKGNQDVRPRWFNDQSIVEYREILEYKESSLELLRETARLLLRVVNPKQLLTMVVFFDTNTDGCSYITASGIQPVLNAIQYINLNDSKKREVVELFKGETTDGGAALSTLLRCSNTNSLIIHGIPVGTPFKPHVPALTAFGQQATLKMLELLINHLLPMQTRTASKCFALKQKAPKTALYLLCSEDKDIKKRPMNRPPSDLIAVAAVHGNFSGSTCELAKKLHGVPHLSLDIDEDVAAELGEAADVVGFVGSCQRKYKKIVEEILISDRRPKPDDYFASLVDKCCRNLTSRYHHIADIDEVAGLGAVYLALFEVGIKPLDVMVTSNHLEVAPACAKLFIALCSKYAGFGSVDVVGMMRTEFEVEECEHLFKTMLIAEELITNTPIKECKIVYSNEGTFMSKARKVFRITEKGSKGLDSFDYVCCDNEFPDFTPGQSWWVHDANRVQHAHAPTLSLMISVDYDWRNPGSKLNENLETIQKRNNTLQRMSPTFTVRYSKAALGLI